MPTIYMLNSTKSDVYSREHLPPHFHALYAEHEILIIISTLATYAGYIPKSQYKDVINWAKEQRVKDFLLENFRRLNPFLR